MKKYNKEVREEERRILREGMKEGKELRARELRTSVWEKEIVERVKVRGKEEGSGDENGKGKERNGNRKK